MEIVEYSNNYLYQQTFQKKWYHFNRNAQLSNVMQEMIQLDFQSESDKKIRPRFHPKTSESATLPRGVTIVKLPSQIFSQVVRFKLLCVTFR